MRENQGVFIIYQRSLQISEARTLADPSNARAHRDVAGSLNNVGEIQAAQGNASAALRSYQQSLQTHEALALADPSSAEAQRDVMVSHVNLWQLATPRAEKIHHALQINRIFTELETRGAHISLDDCGFWARIKQWLNENTGLATLTTIGLVLVLLTALLPALMATANTLLFQSQAEKLTEREQDLAQTFRKHLAATDTLAADRERNMVTHPVAAVVIVEADRTAAVLAEEFAERAVMSRQSLKET